MKNTIIDKVLMVNLTSFTLSFTEIEMTLKVILLLLSIGYTILKIRDIRKKGE